MAMDILHESRLTLTQLARREGVNPSTTWRWVLKGCRGVRLESSLIGGKRVTSDEAFARFVAGINAPPGEHASVRTPKQRERDIEQADLEVAAAGI